MFVSGIAVVEFLFDAATEFRDGQGIHRLPTGIRVRDAPHHQGHGRGIDAVKPVFCLRSPIGDVIEVDLIFQRRETHETHDDLRRQDLRELIVAIEGFDVTAGAVDHQRLGGGKDCKGLFRIEEQASGRMALGSCAQTDTNIHRTIGDGAGAGCRIARTALTAAAAADFDALGLGGTSIGRCLDLDPTRAAGFRHHQKTGGGIELNRQIVVPVDDLPTHMLFQSGGKGLSRKLTLSARREIKLLLAFDIDSFDGRRFGDDLSEVDHGIDRRRHDGQ